MIPIEQILVLLLTSRVCTCCGTRKGRDAFNAHPGTILGLQANCKECAGTKTRNLTQEQRDRVNVRRRLRRAGVLREIKTPEMRAEYWKQYYRANKKRVDARTKQYVLDNKESIRRKAKAAYLANREQAIKNSHGYYWANRKRISEKERERRKTAGEGQRAADRAYRIKWIQDPQNRLIHNLRNRLHNAVKKDFVSARTKELLGCSSEVLKRHLEARFRDGMTWENYGPVWHVDHRKPCDSFDFSDPAQQRECFHYTNLQPLFAAENISKGAKIL